MHNSSFYTFNLVGHFEEFSVDPKKSIPLSFTVPENLTIQQKQKNKLINQKQQLIQQQLTRH